MIQILIKIKIFFKTNVPIKYQNIKKTILFINKKIKLNNKTSISKKKE